MSKIEFEQINEDEIEVTLPLETPLEMVEQIKKSLISRGLIEDLTKSTVSVRYFFRPQDSVNQLADKLIKSLETISDGKLSKIRTPMDQMRFDQQKKNREMRSIPNVSPKPTPNTPQKPMTSTPTFPVGITPKKYIDIADKNQDEDESDVEKSGYGPKGAGLYNPADNIRRKASNVGDKVEVGRNVNVKSYSSKPGQLSAKQQAGDLAAKQRALNRKQPVKTMKDLSPEALADITARNLKKSWANHGSIPTAAEAIQQANQSNPVEKAENLMASQLANLMNNKAMLGQSNRQPTSEDMIMAGEQMGMGTSEEVAKSQDNQWNNTINSWLTEATKPISQRFASEEEELAYWNSIKVGDRDDGKSGY